MTDHQVVASKNGDSSQTAPATAAGKEGATRSGGRNGRDESTLLPPVDVVEDATGITLYADLPGVTKERLDVRVEADTLLIEGEVGLSTPDGMTSSHAEVQLSRYRRTFTLSKELNADKVDAEFVQGVLRVRIPKADDAQPRRIAVHVH